MIEYLIFDGNYILHKCVQALKQSNTIYENLYKLMTSVVDKYVRMNSWKKIIFVSDTRTKSWRAEYKGSYKGKRVRDESIDWKFVFETYELFKNELPENYYVLEHDHIEGDDWILFSSLYANKHGCGSCVISSDKDLYQIIKYNTNKKFINIQINDKFNNEKVIIPEGWEIVYNDIINSDDLNDVFNLNNVSHNLNFFDYCRNNFTILEVNNNKIIFEKLLTGDKGDNVSSAHLVKSKTSERFMGIGEKTAEKTWKNYSEIYSVFNTKNDDDIKNMIESYETIKKKDFSKEIKENIYNNIQHNIKMMELKPRVYPTKIKNIIMEKIINILSND